MNKWASGVFLLGALILGSVNANACLVVDPEIPATEVAGSFEGHGCFVGNQDAHVDWLMTSGHLVSRNVLVTLEVTGDAEISITLLNDVGQELTTFSGTEGSTDADWVLTLGEFRFRVNVEGQGRYVVRTRTGNWPSAINGQSRSSQNPATVRDAFGTTGWVGEVPYYLRWTLTEDAPADWELLFTPSPGLPANVKLFAADGTLLQHLTGEPGAPLTLPFLNLEPGVYTFVAPNVEWSGAALRIDATPLGADNSSGQKSGRPGSIGRAGRITLAGVSGILQEDNRDYYRLHVPVDEEGVYNISVNNDLELDLCLITVHNEELACYRGTDVVAYKVLLDPGTHYLSVSGRRADEPAYRLEFEQVTDLAPVDVIGPARYGSNAFLMQGDSARLSVGSRTITYLAYHVQEPGLYRIQMQAPDLVRISVLDGSLRELRRYSPHSAESVVRVDNLPLREGINYIELDARTGEYALRVLNVGPLPEPHVVEPEAPATSEVAARPEAVIVPSDNISAGTSAELRPGQPYAATLLPGEGRAHYRFSLLNEAMVRLTLTPPHDTAMRMYLSGHRNTDTPAPGEAAVQEEWLPAGDYLVEVRAMGEGQDWYTLELELLDPFSRTGGLYVPTEHNPLPIGSDLRVIHPQALPGHAFHLLPLIGTDTRISVSLAQGPANRVRLYQLQDGKTTAVDHVERQDDSLSFDVTPGEYLLRFEAGQAWDAQVQIQDGPDPVISRVAEEVRLELDLDGEEVAAWSVWGQTLTGILRVSNSGDSDYDLSVLTHATDPRVSFPLAGESVSVAAGENLELPVELVLPADMHSGKPLELTYGVSDGSGVTVSGQASVLPSCEAPLIGGHSWWPVPESLLGHLNVAWQPLGGNLLMDAPTSDSGILDGRVSPARPPVRNLGYQYVLDLGQERELTATALHPTGSHSPAESLRRFQLEVSGDAQDWQVILSDQLGSGRIEQYFTFTEPVRARYARLTLLDSHGSNRDAGIGEWKLLSPRATTDLNIAAAELGGHMVWSEPLLGGAYSMLSDPDYGGEARRSSVSVRAGGTMPTWVLGFFNNRAARIGSIEWLDSDREQNVQQLVMSVSTESPLGPWTEVADWHIERQDGRARLQLEDPVWARFIRFQVPGTAEANVTVELAQQLTVLEADDHGSILGEWGLDSDWAAFEYSNPELFTEATVVFGSNSSQDSALLLTGPETGYVQTGVAESWYRIVMPQDRNLALLDIASEPGVVLGYELFESNGRLASSGVSEGSSLRLSGDSGAEWLLRLFEPPRSVLFAWDTSGSVSPYQSQTYAALERFAGAIRGDLESVMLLAFSRQPNFLLPEWSSDAAEVSRTLNAYDRDDDSSNAELHMAAAASEISKRTGVRAIVFITDAETGGYSSTPEVWRQLERSRAQVYSLEISTAGRAPAQDLMQDWASAGGGHYVNATSLAELEQGFARADCLIRRAKYFEIEVEFQEREAIPGTLVVAQAADDATGGSANTADGSSAIQVILDASGSMYRTLDGRYRYEIAKDVLADLVTNVLPADLPFALRVFGNRQASTCRSDLEVALAPLSADAVSAVIAGIEPQPFAGTPIAASLQAAASDLATATGPSAVILITDGEESCDGDVEVAITELRNAGFDVTLNVIGFDFDAEDPEAARERFRDWAQLGGGQYYDASSADELAGALQSSVALPFEVLDAEGTVVARGTVGGAAIELEGGAYTVRVLAQEPIHFTDIVVDGSLVSLTLD